jgi:hypothetical protein
MTLATLNQAEWMTCKDAARALGIGTPAMEQCAARLKVRVRRVPGRKGALYRRDDIGHAVTELEKQEAARVAAACQPSESGRNKRAMQRP